MYRQLARRQHIEDTPRWWKDNIRYVILDHLSAPYLSLCTFRSRTTRIHRGKKSKITMTRMNSDVQAGFQLAVQGMLSAMGSEYQQLRTQVQNQADRMKHLEEDNEKQATQIEQLQSQVQHLIEKSQDQQTVRPEA